VFENLTWQVSDVPEVQSLAGEVMLGAARELLRNAALHGRGRDPHRALHVTLTLHCTDTIEITISDDGVGAVLPADNHGGLALHSTLMAVIGGTLTLDVDCGTGTKASLILPLPNAAQA
jgi:signal transduction histidine kinase